MAALLSYSKNSVQLSVFQLPVAGGPSAATGYPPVVSPARVTVLLQLRPFLMIF
jgi:hypothetical protein